MRTQIILLLLLLLRLWWWWMMDITLLLRRHRRRIFRAQAFVDHFLEFFRLDPLHVRRFALASEFGEKLLHSQIAIKEALRQFLRCFVRSCRFGLGGGFSGELERR